MSERITREQANELLHKYVKGENYNIKITYPYDIAVAEALLKGEVEC